MEKLQLPKFDHEAEDIVKAMGMSDKVAHYVRSAIIFETISCPMLAKDLFERVEERPRDMVSLTGMLERAMPHMRTSQEEFFCVLMAHEGWERITGMMNSLEEHYEEAQAARGNVINKVISNLTGEHAVHILDVVDLIKETGHNFEKFSEAIIKDENYDADGKYCPPAIDPEEMQADMEDLIKQTLKKAIAAKKNKNNPDTNPDTDK